ncbi:MAG: 1-deoxy-D-xylulose-5-phosphate synthase [bacterium]
MARILDGIDSPEDLKSVDRRDLPRLAREIRQEIIDVVSRHGGHLSSNLGAVELTIALHYIFRSPEDKIIWDVGHQTYAHKLLTGRRSQFPTLRQYGGICGFPRRDESPHDCFGTGHSSTSLSAALGMALARDLRGENYKVVAVIGDGALTAGIAYEALNHAGHLKRDLIVVLNDNRMSISPSVGAISSYLNRIITGQFYNRLRDEAKQFIDKYMPLPERALDLMHHIKEGAKSIFAPCTLFEELGFRYIGPLNGHDLDDLIEILGRVREMKGPILVHVVTQKGMGYPPAEEDPSGFHSAPPFDAATGARRTSPNPSYSCVFGEALVELAGEDRRIVAISAAMCEGTGLEAFRQTFPERFFDVGIAEQHATTLAGGLAAGGLKPVVAIYSSFLQRAYDQIVHDICLQNLPVVFALDRSGLVGADGPTHHGAFDFAYLRAIPNMVVMAPKDAGELRAMLRVALSHNGPIAIRYPRGEALHLGGCGRLDVGRAELLREGSDVAIWAIGATVPTAIEAAEILREEGIESTVVNARFAKPVDADLLEDISKRVTNMISVEDGVVAGGFGSGLLEALAERSISGIRLERVGLPDRFIEHGDISILREKYGLDAQGISKRVLYMLSRSSRPSVSMGQFDPKVPTPA